MFKCLYKSLTRVLLCFFLAGDNLQEFVGEAEVLLGDVEDSPPEVLLGAVEDSPPTEVLLEAVKDSPEAEGEDTNLYIIALA